MGSAFFYGFYLVYMKETLGEDEKIDMFLFFGLVGLICLVTCIPLFPIFHFLGKVPAVFGVTLNKMRN